MQTYVQKNVNEAALYISTNAVPSFDNLTAIPKDIENTFCMAVTGGGISKRKLFTDNDSVLMQLNSPMIMTSLEIPTNASDLLDRTIAVELDRVPQDKRRSDESIKKDYAALLPSILGGMCDALVKMLELRGRVNPANLPRLADHGMWGCAAAMALGYSEDAFLKAYTRSSLRTQTTSLIDEGFLNLLIIFVESKNEIKGFVSKVREELYGFAVQVGLPTELIPKTPQGFSRRLKEIEVPLETAGLKVDFSASARNGRTITLRRIGNDAAPAATEADSSPGAPAALPFCPETLDATQPQVAMAPPVPLPPPVPPARPTVAPTIPSSALAPLPPDGGWLQPSTSPKGWASKSKETPSNDPDELDELLKGMDDVTHDSEDDDDINDND